MALDVVISAILALLTIGMAYLGVHVTLHPPQESPRAQFWYKAGFCLCGLLTVSLVAWQAIRNSKAQQGATHQIETLRLDIEGARAEARNAKDEAQGAKREVQNESNRREQAERDLAIIVQASGRSTRQGVAEDIRKSPIKVEVNGGSIQDPAERAKHEEMEKRLTDYTQQAVVIMNRCRVTEAHPEFGDAAGKWESETYNYLVSTKPSYAARFRAATGPSYAFNNVPQVNENVWNWVNIRNQVLSEILRELSN
jgi:hypothetical protein